MVLRGGGPTYVLKRTVGYYNPHSNNYIEKDELTFRWIGFIEVGRSYYFKEE